MSELPDVWVERKWLRQSRVRGYVIQVPDGERYVPASRLEAREDELLELGAIERRRAEEAEASLARVTGERDTQTRLTITMRRECQENKARAEEAERQLSEARAERDAANKLNGELVASNCGLRIAADEARKNAERLTDLLRVEQDISTRLAPFLCDQIECCRFNGRIRAGDCACYEEKAREHRSRVRAAIDSAKSRDATPGAD